MSAAHWEIRGITEIRETTIHWEIGEIREIRELQIHWEIKESREIREPNYLPDLPDLPVNALSDFHLHAVEDWQHQ